MGVRKSVYSSPGGNSPVALTDRGNWLPSTVYAVDDVTVNAGIRYVCTLPHTSSIAFITDQATKWTQTGIDSASAAVLNTDPTILQSATTTGTAVAGSSGFAMDAAAQPKLAAHDHSSTNKGGLLTVLRIPHTYSVSGTLAVPSGGTNFLPPFAVPVPAGKTVKLAAARIWVRTGTATLSVNKNNVALSGLSALSITSTPTTFTATGTGGDNNLADMDQIAPVISAVSSPDGLSCTLLFDYSL